MILWQRQPPTIISLKSPSLLINNRFRRGSFLVGSLSTCDYKLPSTYFRNFPDLLVTSVWDSHVLSAKLKSPVEVSHKDKEKDNWRENKTEKRVGSPGGQNVEYE